MKIYLILLVAAGISLFATSQTTNYHSLDLNNVNASISDGGVFLNFEASGLPGNEVPSGSMLNTIFAMGFWYGGVDVSNQLKLSAQKYAAFEDQFKGPLTTDGTATADASGAWSIALFPITKAEIDDHIANYMNPGYVVPANIANWPAHGDISNGFDFFLAPFFDYAWDGAYVPSEGDYPCIRGDQAVYVIMNDKGGVHASGGEPIGIEMHYMFYEYTGIPEIENTTFVQGKLINRGTQTLQDFKMSVFLDSDIGFYGDDYFGSDSSRNMMYFYNGDNMDEPDGGSPGYLSAPPATGVISLSHDFVSIGNSISPSSSTAFQYWNLMNSMTENGTPWMDPITMNPTNFLYSGTPGSTIDLNSELAQGNTPGDRRGLATIDLGTLVPNATYTFDYAVIYHRDTVDNVDNAVGLAGVADIVQEFFDTTIVVNCNTNAVGINEFPDVDFSIHPNPSNGHFTISLDTDFSDAQIEIYDISGRSVLDPTELNSSKMIVELTQPTGIYLLHLTVDGRETVKRIVLE